MRSISNTPSHEIAGSGCSEPTRRRLEALDRYDILDTPREASFDELARLAADLCDAPIAAINLIGDSRQFFKAEVGLGVRETPLESSFCVHALLQDDFMLVPDATADDRFAGNPLVTGGPQLRFYAGALLKTGEGIAIGTLCVLDTRPRQLNELQQRALQVLARQAMNLLDLRLTVSREVEARRHYKTLFDSMDEGFCVIEFIDGPHGPLSDYVHVEANAAYAKNTGIPDVVGQKVRDMVGSEADDWVQRYGGVLRTGVPIRFERELEATGRFLSLSAFRIEPPTRRQVAVLFQDVTARRRAEQGLLRLNETLEARVTAALAERKVLADIVEGTDAFVMVTDNDGRVLAVNGAAARDFHRVFGVTLAVGDSLHHVLAEQPDNQAKVTAAWERALRGEEYVEILSFEDPLRQRAYYEARFNPLRDAEGRQIGAYQFVYDVTERLREQERLREAEAALRQSQKMEAVGQLTGGVAHDFNNLLAGIMGSIELLETRMRQGQFDMLSRYVETAKNAARRAASLTHRLLAFSRQQTLAPTAVDINRLVAGMEELIRRTIGPATQLEVVGVSGIWPALIDANQLENALLNLCINARDAMPDGGRLTIETANKWIDEHGGRERDLPPGQYVTICVTDTGTGMTPEVIARAFDPFFTTKPLGAGTGLGLSMVYGFARQSGGQVRIYSEVGKGTTMCIYLPRHRGSVEQYRVENVPARSARADNAGTILVVDDEASVRMFVAEVLSEAGYHVIEASDGATALRLMRAAAKVDLLITDVGLPGGMNGRQLAEAARDASPALKILFITGYAENAVMGHGHLHHEMPILTKPFTMRSLTDKVSLLLPG